jgi:hypothetical protein
VQTTTFTQIAVTGVNGLVFVDGNGDTARELVVVENVALRIVPGGASDGVVVGTANNDTIVGIDVGDLDNDGDEDIATVGADGVVSFVLNDGLGTFALGGSLETGYVGQIDLGDLDGNDTTDLLIAEGSGAPPRIWLGLPGLSFQPANQLDLYDTMVAQGVGQIDSTSADDIVVQDYSTLNFWIGDGSPGGPPDLSFYEQFGVYDVQGTFLNVGDFDGDGIDDVARTLYWGGYVLVDSWQGNSFYELEEWGYPLSPLRTGSGDVNGDGSDDLLFTTDDFLGIRYGTTAFDGLSLFGCFQTVAEPANAYMLATGDFDGDGRDDVAYSWGTGTYVMSIL